MVDFEKGNGTGGKICFYSISNPAGIYKKTPPPQKRKDVFCISVY